MESTYTKTCRNATIKTLDATRVLLNKCAGILPKRRSNAVIGTVLFGWFYIGWRITWFLTAATCVLMAAMCLLSIAATIAPFWGIGVIADKLWPRRQTVATKAGPRTRYSTK